MKKNLLAIIITVLGLFFSANTWAAFYLNVINKAHAGSLTPTYEESENMHSDGVSTFPEQEAPTTLVFYAEDGLAFSDFRIGTPDAKSYCKIELLSHRKGYFGQRDHFATDLKLTSNFSCSLHDVNDNTADLIIEKIESV